MNKGQLSALKWGLSDSKSVQLATHLDVPPSAQQVLQQPESPGHLVL